MDDDVARLRVLEHRFELHDEDDDGRRVFVVDADAGDAHHAIHETFYLTRDDVDRLVWALLIGDRGDAEERVERTLVEGSVVAEFGSWRVSADPEGGGVWLWDSAVGAGTRFEVPVDDVHGVALALLDAPDRDT
jgi:hypothetical protein